MFRHPKYYKELRKRNKSDQAISLEDSTESVCGVRPGPGPKRQASSGKPQAASLEKQASSPEEQASSRKP